MTPTPPAAPREATRLSELSPQQWKSGVAAWLGWLFDGLELHLYTLVAGPLVFHLLDRTTDGALLNEKKAYIQAAFLLGWALGGAFFGRLGDRLGRSRTLALTVLTYALCTGLCAFAQTWWQLMIFRFVAALGIGGEWAVGASLLSETWPKAWRPWLAAVLQTGVNLGILIAAAVVGLVMPQLQQFFVDGASPGWLHGLIVSAKGVLPRLSPEHLIFLIGVVPAIFVFWIRKKVPETEAWHDAKASTAARPGVAALFQGDVARTSWVTMAVCALSLSAWWLFTFWHPQHLRRILENAQTPAAEITPLITKAFFTVIAVSIAGNFFAGWLARRLGNPRAILLCFLGLGGGMVGAFIVPRGFGELAWFWCPLVGFFSGVFGLFTMYLPPLFPVLLRTTGAGFCYNIGRTAAAAATIVFGLLAPVQDLRTALLWSSGIAFAGAVAALWLPVRTHENEAT
ncbi:MAG: MFS transporter [Verrucomicrobia bacterium]|nr:MFS transporter [Verrucomicrobiota bacterium]